MVNLTYNAFQKRPKTPKNKNTAPSLSAEKKFKVFKKFKSVFKKRDMKILTQKVGLGEGECRAGLWLLPRPPVEGHSCGGCSLRCPLNK